ncbi:hypothetical protein DFH29DRAFT_871455 [Suillus ampliporus]|nr:hypothetical protein DFH29DRAFT_871455 [Suillus ampliporus]
MNAISDTLCCLCADGGGRGAYTEAAVYPWTDKMTKETYWSTRCASDKCGYQVKIDKYFHLSSLATFQYPRQENTEDYDEPCPIQLEWTYREQTELWTKLGSSVGDGIMAKGVLSETSDESPYPRLLRRDAKMTTKLRDTLSLKISEIVSCPEALHWQRQMKCIGLAARAVLFIVVWYHNSQSRLYYTTITTRTPNKEYSLAIDRIPLIHITSDMTRVIYGTQLSSGEDRPRRPPLHDRCVKLGKHCGSVTDSIAQRGTTPENGNEQSIVG